MPALDAPSRHVTMITPQHGAASEQVTHHKPSPSDVCFPCIILRGQANPLSHTPPCTAAHPVSP